MANLNTLQSALGYEFRDLALLQQALTHRSHGMPHNERLEFLGDSVLNFVVATLLFAQHGELDEGGLSRARASLVKQATLASIAVRLNLGEYLRLGEGELKSGGFRRPSIQADAVEAILGAILLDGGYPAAELAIRRLYEPLLAHLDPAMGHKDPKTRLQEFVQARHLNLPRYTVLETRGAAHDQTFDVACEVPALDIRECAAGSSRRAAEQAAAQQALAFIKARGLAHRARTARRAEAAADADAPSEVSPT